MESALDDFPPHAGDRPRRLSPTGLVNRPAADVLGRRLRAARGGLREVRRRGREGLGGYLGELAERPPSRA
eukprot:11199147-Lingulodinium_polyedra.AAC.1